MSYRYDIHTHTDASSCSRMKPEELVEAALDRGLDGIAVTDHDKVVAVEDVREEAPEELEVIKGVEVTTTEGHMLALDVGEPPSQQDPVGVIEDIHDQGGYAVLAHPFDRLRQVYSTDLDEIAEKVDAVETVNSRCIRKKYNSQAEVFAQKYGIRATGGSDAHFPHEVGRAFTETSKPILEAFQDGDLEPRGRGRYLSGHFLTKTYEALSVLER